MNRTAFKLFLGLTALLFALPAWAGPEPGKTNPQLEAVKEKIKAHRAQQKAENKAFRDSVKDLSPQEKAKAAANHRNEQFQENVAFRSSLHAERMAKLRERLSKNANLSETDKQEILNFAEQQYQKAYEHAQTQHTENIAVLEQIANNPDISAEESRKLIKEQVKTQHEENKQFRQDLKTERQTQRQGWRDKIKTGHPKPAGNTTKEE